jgi:peptidyl-prolyl cis-trans isomerase D
MLQAIREKAQGWIAWAIVILISIPFALWGIQEYLGVGGEPVVAVVDGDEITQRMLDQRTRDFRESMRFSLGDSYNPRMFDDSMLKPQVLDALVEEMVLSKRAADWNLRTSDAQARGFIASIPAFQRDGRFDQVAYDTAVRNRGMSRAGFEQSVRQEMAVAQLRNGVRETVFVTEQELQTRVRLNEQQRSIRFARVPAAAYRDGVEVTEDKLRSFYEAHPDRYRTPERVKLNYLVLDDQRLKGLVDVSEEALRQYFQDHKAEFIAREERAARHILIAVPAGADEAAEAEARAEAEDVLTRLRAGADFAALAKEHSDDPGSSGTGGDLGWVERGVMVPAFEEAAFALERDALSDPVRTDFGFHIIQVTDIRGGSDAGFEELRDKVEAAYRKFEAENLYFDYAERLAETAYENSASLTPAAETLGLEIKSSDWVTRDGRLAPPLDSPKVVNAAFSDDVLLEGHNSELIEIAPQRSVVVRVAEHEPAGVKPLEEHRAEIEQDFIERQAAEAAAEAGTKALAALRAGQNSLPEIAEQRGWTFEEPGMIGRDNTELPREIVSEAFSLQPPGSGSARYTGAALAGGDFVVIEVGEALAGELKSLPEARRELLAQQAAGQQADAQMQSLIQSLRERADIEIRAIEE